MALTSLPAHPGVRSLTYDGSGEPTVLVHGYGLTPRAYTRTARLLSDRGHDVIVPWWREVDGHWTAERAMAGMLARIDAEGFERVTLVGHSFGGALALGLAARHPERTERLVIADSIALSNKSVLLRNVVPGSYVWRLATARAALDFVTSWLLSPGDLARAGWWGFSTDHGDEMDAVAEADVEKHVLWASRDTLLDREDGRAFAERIDATFAVVPVARNGGPVDHDWMYRHPRLFVAALESLTDSRS